MARKRMLHASLLEDEKIGELSDRQYRLYTGCYLVSDDYGRFRASPKYLKRMIFAYSDTVGVTDIEADFNFIAAEMKLIGKYQAEGDWYGLVANFFEEQRISNPTPSKLPPPELPLLQFLGISAKYWNLFLSSGKSSLQSSHEFSHEVSQNQSNFRIVESQSNVVDAAVAASSTDQPDLFNYGGTKARWAISSEDDGSFLDLDILQAYQSLASKPFGENDNDPQSLEDLRNTKFSSKTCAHLMRIISLRYKKPIFSLSFFSQSILERSSACEIAVRGLSSLAVGGEPVDYHIALRAVIRSLKEWDTRAA